MQLQKLCLKQASLRTSLCILAGCCLAASVQSQPTYPPPNSLPSSYPPSPSGSSGPSYPPTYPPPPPPAAATVTGNLRYIGPLSSGCRVFIDSNFNSVLLTNGSTITTKPLTSLDVLSNSSSGCTDTFTGLPVPLFLYADTPFAGQSFIVSPVTKLAEYTVGSTTATNSYIKVGLPNIGEGETVDVYALLARGSVQQGLAILSKDVQISTAMLLSASLLLSFNPTGNFTLNDYADGFSFFITNQAPFFDVTSPTVVEAGILFAASTLSLDTQVQNRSSAIRAVASAIAQIALASAASLSDSSLHAIIYNIKLASGVQSVLMPLLSSTPPASLNTTLAPLLADMGRQIVAQGPILPDAVLSALGLTSPLPEPVTANLTVFGYGPLAGASVMYENAWTMSEQDVTTGATGSVSLVNASMGTYEIARGANDTFLLSPTLISYMALLPSLLASSSSVTVGPGSSLVFWTWFDRQATVPSLPLAANWKTMYEKITGVEVEANYLARSWSAGGGVALGVAIADQLINSVPMLGATFLNASLPSVDVDVAAHLIFRALTDFKSSTSFTNATTVKVILQSAYDLFAGENVQELPTIAVPRRYLQQTATISSILDSLVSAITASNQASAVYLVQAAAAIRSGTAPDAALFKSLAQISKVQATSIAAAIRSVGSLVRSGNLASAAAAASQAASDFTGDNLQSAIAAAVVNEDAITILITQSQSSTNSNVDNDDNDRSLRLGLGIGLGLGLGLILIAVVVLVVVTAKNRRSAQSTAPVATAESTVVFDVSDFRDDAAAQEHEEQTMLLVADADATIAAYYRARFAEAIATDVSRRTSQHQEASQHQHQQHIPRNAVVPV